MSIDHDAFMANVEQVWVHMARSFGGTAEMLTAIEILTGLTFARSRRTDDRDAEHTAKLASHIASILPELRAKEEAMDVLDGAGEEEVKCASCGKQMPQEMVREGHRIGRAIDKVLNVNGAALIICMECHSAMVQHPLPHGATMQ